ncbi:MAG: tRNA (adenosine(37)-N6)-threonylcarbamoyltransferase complex dimerization subunit type 1 TsaB [Pirellulaceae bacterium]|nr:tRNA (adenosine(37)-N6)-threonylcarbamoyltransferase complex dimerization subunit type 1 TsaB [Pirellulaceae bacterium]
MLTLGIETSARAGSVALVAGDAVLAALQLPAATRSAQSLAPAIGQILSQTRKQMGEVGLVAATVGPGSFTGLRVGVTTAKTLAYALGCDVLGLDTLDVIAHQVAGDFGAGQLECVLDAQRAELFVARFEMSPAGPRRLAPNRLVASESWRAELAPGAVVAGPVLANLVARLPAGVIVADKSTWEPQAATVARLAAAAHAAGRRDDLWKLAPAYGRASAAEEKAGRTG